MVMLSKPDLRTTLLAKRRQIKPLDRAKAAENAAVLFAATDFFKASEHIACYYPTANEFDCLTIIETIWAVHKQCYLPRLTPKEENTLDFVRYQQNDTLQPNKYQILEPAAQKIISLTQLNVVLCPLVGFDLTGNRLGMGAGYYDRTFESIRHENREKCYLIGLAYEAQLVPEVPTDPWDLVLDGVVTEKRVIVF